MDFLFQLKARDLPPEARELTTLKSGLLQVFNCILCSNENTGRDEDVLQGMWVVPEDELVPSLWSLAASALVATGRDLSALPDTLANRVRAHTVSPSFGYEPKETEVASWAELGNEVPAPEEVQEALDEEGVRTVEELDEDRVRPEEIIAERHRDGVGVVRFPRHRYGRSYGYIKLGGWIRWFDDYVNYPQCPDCNVKMTAPLLEFYAPDKMVWAAGYEGDATGFITLCPKCQRQGFQWHQAGWG